MNTEFIISLSQRFPARYAAAELERFGAWPHTTNAIDRFGIVYMKDMPKLRTSALRSFGPEREENLIRAMLLALATNAPPSPAEAISMAVPMHGDDVARVEAKANSMGLSVASWLVRTIREACE